MQWMAKLRLRVLAFVLGLVLAVIGILSLWAVPVWSVLGVAVAAAAVAVNSMTAKLSHPTCYACGLDLSETVAGDYGVACPQCGAVNLVGSPALTDREPDELDDSAAA